MKQYCAWCKMPNTKIREPEKRVVILNGKYIGEHMFYDTWNCRHCFQYNNIKVEEYRSKRWIDL